MIYKEERINAVRILSFLKGSQYVLYVGPELSYLQLRKLKVERAGVKFLYLPEILGQLSDSVIKYNFPGVSMPESLAPESLYGKIRQRAGVKMAADRMYAIRHNGSNLVVYDAGTSFTSLDSYLRNVSHILVKPKSTSSLDKVILHNRRESTGNALFFKSMDGFCGEGLFNFISESPVALKTSARTRMRSVPDQTFDEEMQAAFDEAQELIKGLLVKGCPPELLLSLINQNVKLSRLRITRQYKIILVDYDNIEIKLSPLPKAVFLFFLRHPEGVMFSHLQDHRKELLDIYSHLCTNDDQVKMKESIDRLVDSFDNSISEKCAAVKKAFLLKIADNIACNYYITGAQGDRKGISLNRDLVEWKCDL